MIGALLKLKNFLNPYLVLAIVSISIASAGTGYWRGVKNTTNRIEATEARLERTRQEVYDAALAATAAEISKIKIVNTTVRQELEREVRTEKIYAQCSHSDNTFGLLNAVIKGEIPAESFSGFKLPATQPVN